MSRIPPVIDMAPDGTFRTKPPGMRAPLSFKLLLGATIVAVLAGAAAVAALALWIAALLLPVAVIAVVVAWGTYQYRVWRRRGASGAGRPVHYRAR